MDEKIFNEVVTELRGKSADIDIQLIKAKTSTDTMLNMLSDVLPKLSKLSKAFMLFPLNRRHEFISVLFPFPLSYNKIYRTTSIHKLFADKALILKEKGLLEIEQPLEDLGKIPASTQDRNPIELLETFLAVLSA
ncbi:MAG: hypothetical protein KA954_01350 [Chitinophagales bacterium]|nr:hypothetical protein [Chitinophagales bacterium]MBP9845820.1 hypothetical protein [Saprospiraceae bacterium]